MRVATASLVIAAVAIATIELATAAPVTPPGDWRGHYGAGGYDLAAWGNGGDLASLRNATLTLTAGRRWLWAEHTGSGRALQGPEGSTRKATAWYSDRRIVMQLKFSAAYIGTCRCTRSIGIDWDAVRR